MLFRRKPQAGGYAEQRYRRGLRSWQAKNRLLFLAICAPFIVAGLLVGVLVGDMVAWIGGMVAGGFAAMWMFLRDTPPPYVEKWHDGAEGERKTEKALRPLERAGWHVVHDVQNGYGNYDHIVVGTAGVYLLDSKNLQGIVAIQSGVPHLARRHDPDDKVIFDRIRPHTLASAARLKGEIEARTSHRPWVHAVVVFWSEFPESFVEADKCVFIEGSRLCAWLQSQPDRLAGTAVEEISTGIANLADKDAAHGIPRSSELSPA